MASEGGRIVDRYGGGLTLEVHEGTTSIRCIRYATREMAAHYLRFMGYNAENVSSPAVALSCGIMGAYTAAGNDQCLIENNFAGAIKS